jgi:hypothetical protein
MALLFLRGLQENDEFTTSRGGPPSGIFAENVVGRLRGPGKWQLLLSDGDSRVDHRIFLLYNNPAKNCFGV